jgi:hypothetical protein
MKLNDIWSRLGLSMVLFVMPKPLSVRLTRLTCSRKAVGVDVLGQVVMLSEHFSLWFAP